MRSLRAAVVLAALVGSATDVAADEGLYLTWNECVLAASASHDLSWACDANTGQHDLYCAFRLAAPVDSVLGFEIVVDIQHADDVLPDWWGFVANDCRYGQLGAGLSFTTHSDCADFSLGRATGGVLGYYETQPRGATNQARIKVAGSWLPDYGYGSLDAASTYYAARVIIGNALSTGAEACAGCADPACLVLNAVWLRRQPGALGGDVLVSVGGEGNANWATWQGGAGASCGAVPVRATSWGRIKGLYR